MFTLLKAGCLAIYALALASLFWTFPNGVGPVIQIMAVALLAVHALEVPFVFKHIKLHAGPVSHSVGLTLLFGFLHWMPLAKANRQAANP
ncbi:MAG: hypothetical protein H7Y28_04875 [Rhodoferax sp.]|nr:hypothetical protein [Rhodoferax sp.]